MNSHGVIGSLDNDQEDCAACLKGSCRSINGIYTMPDLPPGYSLVAQIPTGACRIFIQQMKHSRNFLGKIVFFYIYEILNFRVFEEDYSAKIRSTTKFSCLHPFKEFVASLNSNRK